MDKEQHIEADEQHVPATPSPGQVLREAREEQGLSQQAIAEKLYLKVGIIDDIEQNRLDDSTSVTFIKGYVRLYAKNIGLNPEEVLTLFNQYHTTTKPPAKLQSFSRRVAKQAHDDRWMMVTYGIAIVLIAGVVVWWYQQPANDTNDVPSSPVNPITQPAQMNQSDGDAQNRTETVEPVEEDSLETDNDAQPAANEPVIAEVPVTEVPPQTPAADDEVDVAEPETALAQPEMTPLNDTTDAIAPAELVFQFSEDCWVNVTDASGEAIAYGIKASGYEMRVTGLPPFEVTLGAPSVVQISYNGETVDMSGFDPTRTAKFLLPMQDQ